MHPFHTPAAPAMAVLLLLTALPALADEGHDHGAAAATVGSTAMPRWAAVSEAFELVGVLDGKQLTLYLDRFADNAPVHGAQIELEIAGTRFKAVAHGDTYGVTLVEAPGPGVLPITATVTAGAEVDLLAGDLDLREPPPTREPAAGPSWKSRAGWVAGSLLALAMLVFGARRLRAGAVA